MTTHRVMLFDHAGMALAGAEIRTGGADLLACWIEDVTTAFAARGITDVVAVEFDPNEGGEYAARRAIECHTLRMETRKRPDGVREFVSMHHVDDRREQGRGHRILHSTVPGLSPTATLRGRFESIGERAQRHRLRTNPRAWGIR